MDMLHTNMLFCKVDCKFASKCLPSFFNHAVHANFVPFMSINSEVDLRLNLSYFPRYLQIRFLRDVISGYIVHDSEFNRFLEI